MFPTEQFSKSTARTVPSEPPTGTVSSSSSGIRNLDVGSPRKPRKKHAAKAATGPGSTYWSRRQAREHSISALPYASRPAYPDSRPSEVTPSVGSDVHDADPQFHKPTPRTVPSEPPTGTDSRPSESISSFSSGTRHLGVNPPRGRRKKMAGKSSTSWSVRQAREHSISALSHASRPAYYDSRSPEVTPNVDLDVHDAVPQFPKPRKQMATKAATKTSVPVSSLSLEIHQSRNPQHPTARAMKQIAPTRSASHSNQHKILHPYVSHHSMGPFSLTRADAQFFASPRMSAAVRQHASTNSHVSFAKHRFRPTPTKSRSPRPPYWLSSEEEFVTQARKRSFDQFEGVSKPRNSRMKAISTGAMSIARTQPRQNVISAISAATSSSENVLKEHFPELRDAEIMPGGVLKIYDDRGEKLTQEQFAIKAARKSAPVELDESDFESESDSESFSGSGHSVSGSDTNSRASSSKPRSTTSSHPPSPSQILPGRHMASPAHTTDGSPTDTLPDNLIRALERLSLSSLRMQHSRPRALPFLLRNLRKGFKKMCDENDIPTSSTVPFPLSGVTVLLRHPTQERASKVMMKSSWLCPLCELHGRFETPETLQKHLDWDHSSVRVIWEENKITLTLATGSDGEDEGWSAGLTPLPRSLPPSHSPAVETTPLGPPSIIQDADNVSTTISTPKLAIENSVSFHLTQSPFRPQSSAPAESPAPLKFKYQHHPLRSASTSMAPSRTRSVSTAFTIRRASSPSRYPTPPPPDADPLGPAAQYPYLPYGEIQYSCRVGGPRLYDLIGLPTVEECGLLAWNVVEREEEIFELDDVRDEDKVMMALWGRWIVHGRKLFVKKYHSGVMDFVDNYWRMIHHAAGWTALKVFLSMLLLCRFLKGTEVVKILRHYEVLVGLAEHEWER